MLKEATIAAKNIAKKHPLILFYLIAIAIALLYFYQIILFRPPQSIHRWRQTDSASITLNMYQHGMKFFKPEVHSLTADDNTTGYAAAEAPLLYYLIALLYKLFGPHDYIYRIVNTLTFLIGLGAVFNIAKYFLRDFMLAAFVSLIAFVSPAVVYYGNNFLTDSTALALVFIGWWQYIRFTYGKQYSLFVFAVLLFSAAGLLKVTMSLNLFALGGLAILAHTNFLRKSERHLFPSTLATFLPLFFGLAIIVAWYLYAIRYNRQHQSGTFLTGITPWWVVDPQQRHEFTRMIVKNNLTLYYSSGVLYSLALAAGLIICYFKHIPKFIGILALLLFFGGVVYVNLYYNQFVYHDYYFLVLISPVIFIVLSAFIILQSKFPKLAASWFFKLSLIVFLIINVSHARHEMKLRYFGWKRESPVFEDHFTIQPYLRSIGIKPDDRVISLSDVTNCYTLYLMNQPGNNLRGVGPDTKETIEKFIYKGARYLVINDTSYLNKPELQNFLKHKAGQYGSVQIFSIGSNNLPEQ
jgi:4-amino-4-deoxy-L-arabinose transferase-like glycosyltransferase